METFQNFDVIPSQFNVDGICTTDVRHTGASLHIIIYKYTYPHHTDQSISKKEELLLPRTFCFQNEFF
jgi:hypothetical protein